jgi:hypothetical protein
VLLEKVLEMATEVQTEAMTDAKGVDRITIHSPRLNCNAYLLELLNAAIWLAERADAGTSRERSIEILLYPVGSPWVRWACALFDPSRSLSRARDVMGRLRLRTNAWGRREARRGSSIIELVRVQSSPVRIRVDERLTVNIQRITAGYAEAAVLTIRACIRAFRIWKGCRQNSRLNAQAFLRSRYREVQIGDLVASETIAASPAAGGSLQCCGMPSLFGCLVDAVYMVDYILSRTWKGHGCSYVTTSETSYLDEIYRRTLRVRGFNLLELQDYTGRLRVITPGEEWPNPFVARTWRGETLSRHQRECAQQYLAERVTDPGRHLWDMYVGRNSRAKDSVLDERGSAIARDDRSLTVIICLHCFDDAQYWLGLDGFEDLYEWTVVSIDECLGNRQIGHILLKDHPNVDSAGFSGNRRAVERLRERYQHEPRITVLDRHTNIEALASLGLVYGITSFGRVAEELVAVGIPVIASSKGPWGKSYPFLRMWDSPDEYASILRSLTVADWRAPGTRELEALAQFVHEYHLNLIPGDDLPISVQWMVWEDPSINILARDISDRAERQIAELEPTSEQLLAWLRGRAKAYRRGLGTTRTFPNTGSAA